MRLSANVTAGLICPPDIFIDANIPNVAAIPQKKATDHKLVKESIKTAHAKVPVPRKTKRNVPINSYR